MKKLFSVLTLLAVLQGCASHKPGIDKLVAFTRLCAGLPLAKDQTAPATGGIYGNRQSDAWFGRGRNYQIGDLITVMLNESTQADRSQKTDVSRDAKQHRFALRREHLAGQCPSLFDGLSLNAAKTASQPAKGSAAPSGQLDRFCHCHCHRDFGQWQFGGAWREKIGSVRRH